MEPNPVATSMSTVQTSDFVLEREIEESVPMSEDDYDEAQCRELVACGHLPCARSF